MTTEDAPITGTGSFASWLKAARAARGWSGERLAEEIGTSQGNISLYEKGERTPRRERAIEIADALCPEGVDDTTRERMRSEAQIAAGHVPKEMTPGRVVTPSGKRFKVRVRLGEPGTLICVSEEAAKILEALDMTEAE